jgi:hypothetical protein
VSYCPRCYTEYVEGTAQCEDCCVPLQPGEPPERSRGAVPTEIRRDVKLVRVRTFSGPTALLDADVARNILQAQGIPCFVPGETSVELLPVLDVPLLVREQDVEKAEAILKSYLDTPGLAPVD